MGLKRQIQLQEVIRNDKKKNAETTGASLGDMVWDMVMLDRWILDYSDVLTSIKGISVFWGKIGVL